MEASKEFNIVGSAAAQLGLKEISKDFATNLSTLQLLLQKLQIEAVFSPVSSYAQILRGSH